MSRFPDAEKIKNILVMKPHGGLGDLLLSTPVIQSLRDTCPQSRITAMVREIFVPVVEGHTALDHVIGIPEEYARGFSGFPAQLALVREGKYDLAVVLWTSAREAYLLALAGIPFRVGQGSRLLYSFLFTHKVVPRSEAGDEDSHQVENLLDYVRVLGITPRNPRLEFHIPDEARESANKILEEIGIGRDDAFIGFNVTKGLPVTPDQWPVEKFASFAHSLHREFGLPVVFTGIPREKEIVDKVLKHLEGPFYSVAGGTSIKEAGALIARSRLFVSPDSGPMHIAAAVGTPVVGIFGLLGDFPRRWAPYGCPHRIVRLDKIPCPRQCIKETCPRFSCYEAIPDEMVVRAARELLKETES